MLLHKLVIARICHGLFVVLKHARKVIGLKCQFLNDPIQDVSVTDTSSITMISYSYLIIRSVKQDVSISQVHYEVILLFIYC